MVVNSTNNTFSIQKVNKYLEGLNTWDKKLNYLYKVRDDVFNYEKSKGKIKLLSTAEDRLFMEFKKDILDIISIYEKERDELKKQKNKNPRKKEDYIIWIGGRTLLKSLLSKLIETKCIINFDKSDIDIIIFDHFYIDGFTEKINHITPKMIQWGRTYPLLLYLFECLYSIKDISKLLNHGKTEKVLDAGFHFSRHSLISKQFISIKEKKISNKVLARTELRYKKDDDKTKPINHEIIDGIIESIFFKKS